MQLIITDIEVWFFSVPFDGSCCSFSSLIVATQASRFPTSQICVQVAFCHTSQICRQIVFFFSSSSGCFFRFCSKNCIRNAKAQLLSGFVYAYSMFVFFSGGSLGSS